MATSERAGIRLSIPFLVLVLALYASALFSVNNVILDVAREGWTKIQLIQGSFAPAADAQKLYQNAGRSQAVDSNGALPDVSPDGKVRPYDMRIIDQAAQERQLRGPETFTK
ncbi:MAG TPA: hypothetical protein VK009_10545 [Chloroflexota bacterium]|nr:hypothetical protein [Chloroflexota bacterium]